VVDLETPLGPASSVWWQSGVRGAQVGNGDLERFVEAQSGSYERALDELRAGSKGSHWMWFVFPQLRGLGRSATAHRYGLESLDEAARYLAHPVLGRRLRECTEAVNQVKGRSAPEIFGFPDDLKFHSSMTLFHLADPSDPGFETALGTYFDGQEDRGTLELLGRA
jgi:uncharacterized protein (DUF1810 family)